jgi:hypothetical protein
MKILSRFCWRKNPSYQVISFSTQFLGHALMVLNAHLLNESIFKLS